MVSAYVGMFVRYHYIDISVRKWLNSVISGHGETSQD